MNIEIKEKNEDTSEPSGMIVAVRIKPLDDKHETDMSIQSVGHNLLKVLLYEPKTYQFDYVHWSTKTSMDYPSYVTQEMVFDTIGQPIVQNSSLGYNCSLFAYGQTVYIHPITRYYYYNRVPEKHILCLVRKMMKDLSLVCVGH